MDRQTCKEIIQSPFYSLRGQSSKRLNVAGDHTQREGRNQAWPHLKLHGHLQKTAYEEVGATRGPDITPQQ